MSSHNSEAAYASAEIANIIQMRQNHFFQWYWCPRLLVSFCWQRGWS